MAYKEEIGGPLFVGAGGMASEVIPEHDATVDVNQVVGNAVLAGPVTFNAIVTITGVVVIFIMGLELDGVNGIIKNSTSDGDVTIKGNDDGSEISALILDMSDAGTATFNHDIKLGDNSKTIFGAGNDLQIYHDGTNSYIVDDGTGQLRIDTQGTDVRITKTNSEYMARFVTDGSVELYYDNTLKFLTSSTGINLPVDGDSIKFGANSEVVLTHVHNAGLELSAAGNLDTLKLVSTDADANPGPVLNYYRNSGSAQDNDYVGRNIFTFNNDAPEIETALAQNIIMTDVSNGSEDVKYVQEQMTAGSIVERFTISASEAVFNEGSVDVDFRVESNDNANMLTVNGGNNIVGIGADPDLGVGLHIKSGDSGLSSLGDNDADELVIEGSANSGMSILSGTGNAGRIYFGDSGDVNIGFIHYAHDDNAFLFGTNTSTKFTIGSSETVVNDGSLDHDFRVESNGDTHALFVDAGLDTVIMGASGEYSGTGAKLTVTPQIDVGDTSLTGTSAIHLIRAASTGVIGGLYGKWAGYGSGGYIKFHADNVGGGSQTASIIMGTTLNNSTSDKFIIAGNGDLTAVDTSIGSISDERLKESIADFNYDISKFKQLKPRSYKWKNPIYHGGRIDENGDALTSYGTIAQEVEAVDSDYVRNFEIKEEVNLDKNLLDADNVAKTTTITGKEHAMYISVIQQLITRIEALEG